MYVIYINIIIIYDNITVLVCSKDPLRTLDPIFGSVIGRVLVMFAQILKVIIISIFFLTIRMRRGTRGAATAAAATLGAVGGGGNAETPIRLADATMKKLRKRVGVENLIVSEAVRSYRSANPENQATRAIGLAKALLLHLGVGEIKLNDETIFKNYLIFFVFSDLPFHFVIGREDLVRLNM